MSAEDYLREILAPRVIVGGDTRDPKRTVVKLQEKLQPKNKILLYVPPGSVVFHLDTFPAKSPFLNSKKNLHKGCDYVVFCPYREKYWFVLIELKSSDTAGAEIQLSYSIAFVRYLRELIFLHEGDGCRYELTCLLFSSAPKFTKKTPTHPGKDRFRVYRMPSNPDRLSYYAFPYSQTFNLDLLLDSEPQASKSHQHDLLNAQRCYYKEPEP
ncbi:MAG: hypothetical protein HQL90_11275 [Magnetococcales bacterium]|nr:hypothetical protein [Magnetococcales bacterium]